VRPNPHRCDGSQDRGARVRRGQPTSGGNHDDSQKADRRRDRVDGAGGDRRSGVRADAGPTSNPSASTSTSPSTVTKIATAGSAPGKAKKDPGAGANQVAAVAKDLGVTVDQLDTAFRSTKEWIVANQATPTPEMFAAHVASLLGLPADRVLSALEEHGLLGGPVPDGKPGAKAGGHGVDMTKAAHELNATTRQLQDALVQTKMWIGRSGTPEAFAGHVASILGVPADKVLLVLSDIGLFPKTGS
jgi:hypothetical protein